MFLFFCISDGSLFSFACLNSRQGARSPIPCSFQIVTNQPALSIAPQQNQCRARSLCGTWWLDAGCWTDLRTANCHYRCRYFADPKFGKTKYYYHCRRYYDRQVQSRHQPGNPGIYRKFFRGKTQPERRNRRRCLARWCPQHRCKLRQGRLRSNRIGGSRPSVCDSASATHG